jgi:hypothetical protein
MLRFENPVTPFSACRDSTRRVLVSVGSRISAEPALRSARSTADGPSLPQHDRCAERANGQAGDREGAPLMQAGHRERQHDGDEPTRGDYQDDRPGLEQDGRQGGRFRCHTHNVTDYGYVRNEWSFRGFPETR